MSQRKPVCRKFLEGKCRGKCDFFHPKNGGQKQTGGKHYEDSGPRHQRYEDSGPRHQRPDQEIILAPQPAVQQQLAIVPVVTPPPVNPEIEKLKKEVYERELARLREINRIARIAEKQKRIEDYKLRMAEKKELAKQAEQKALAEAPAFTQEKINKWIVDIMKIIEAEDSLIMLYTKLTGKRAVEVMDLIKTTHIVVPDVIAFLGRAITNQDWLKELQLRFLDFSYSGIKSFSMDAIKPLFSFVIVQLYVKCNYKNYENLDKLVGLFVCIIKLIQKLGIVIEMEDYTTVEYKWNAGFYEMWN